MSYPKVSIIILNWNGWKDTIECLESLYQITYPNYDVILVDNGSVDDTKQVVSQFSALGNVRYVFEPIPGLSQARNTGVKASQGEIVAFIDDDAIADRDWLLALRRICRDTDATCVGGRVKGLWLCPRPRWFHPDMDGLLSLLDLGEYRTEFYPPANSPIGTNISFQQGVFSKYGFFNTDLGRGGSKITTGEEVELFNNLLADGALALYCPDAIVYHKVTPDRLQLSRLIKLAYNGGRVGALLQLKHCSWHDHMRVSARHLVRVLRQLWHVMHGLNKQSSSRRWDSDEQTHWTAKLFWMVMKTLMALGYACETVYT